MKEMQNYAKTFQKEMDWDIKDDHYESSRSSLLNNYMLLTTEVAEVAEEMRKAFNMTHRAIQSGVKEEEAFRQAKASIKEDLGMEMADCLAYMCKIANYFEIDLEDSFYEKMEKVKNRQNKDVRLK